MVSWDLLYVCNNLSNLVDSNLYIYILVEHLLFLCSNTYNILRKIEICNLTINNYWRYCFENSFAFIFENISYNFFWSIIAEVCTLAIIGSLPNLKRLYSHTVAKHNNDILLELHGFIHNNHQYRNVDPIQSNLHKIDNNGRNHISGIRVAWNTNALHTTMWTIRSC